eukprot:m.32808 g.32808  ORF g.32808 m.32808 type:complete len:53 (-) comp8451_c0_seq3:1154-1312(-)
MHFTSRDIAGTMFARCRCRSLFHSFGVRALRKNIDVQEKRTVSGNVSEKRCN